MREETESVRSKVGDFYFLEVPDPHIRCTTLHRKSNNPSVDTSPCADESLSSKGGRTYSRGCDFKCPNCGHVARYERIDLMYQALETRE